jgi:hypothetical protein
MDNPEALTETEKTKKEKPQHRTLKRWAKHEPH